MEGVISPMQGEEERDQGCQSNPSEINRYVDTKRIHNAILRIGKDLSSKQHAWIIILWVVLLVIILYQGRQIHEMRTEVTMLQESVDAKFMMITNGISYLQNNMVNEVTGEVEALYTQTMSELDSYQIRYTDVDFAKQTVTVELQLNLKSYENNSTYQSTILNLGDNTTNSVAFEGDKLIRACTFLLSTENNYTMSIEKENDNGGTKLTTESIPLSMYDEMSNRTQIISEYSAYSEYEAKKQILFRNTTFGDESGSIERVDAILSYQDQEFLTLELSEVPVESNSLEVSGEVGTSSSSVSLSVTGSDDKTVQVDPATSKIEELGVEGMTDLAKDASDYELREFEFGVTLDTIRSSLSMHYSENMSFTDLKISFLITYENGTQVTKDESAGF